MNFLAHAFLSGPSDLLLVGNFMGDFVKGRQYLNYDKEIARGVILHREIDHYTDNNLFIKQSKKRLRTRYRHFAPVVVDIFYDHLLVNNWKRYSPIDINEFVSHVYDVMQDHYEVLPEKLQYMLPYMIENNWLVNYGYFEGVRRSLRGMANRSKFKTNIESAVEELETYYNDFDNEFNLFFPQLIDHVNQFLKSGK